MYATIKAVAIRKTEDMAGDEGIFDVMGACAFMVGPSGLSSGEAEIGCYAAAMAEGGSGKEYSFTFHQTKPMPNPSTAEGGEPGVKKSEDATLADDNTNVINGEDEETAKRVQSVKGTEEGVWAFIHHEEDWGNVCVVEVKKDNLQIGFMATPGLEKIAYIEGLDVQSVNAVWQVDANKAYPLGRVDELTQV